MPACSQRVLFAFFCIALSMNGCQKAVKKKFGLSSPHVENQLIVTLKDDIQKSSAMQSFRSFSQESEALNGRSYLLKFDSKTDLEAMAERLAARGDVVAVEANQIYKLLETKPNDPSFLELWGLKNEGQENGRAGVDIGAATAWEQTTGSRDVVVAVIDSGVDYNHPDLRDNIYQNPGETGIDANGSDMRSNGLDDDGNGLIDDWRGYDFIDNDNDPMDQHSHGTHVAGTIGAKGDNAIGIAGVNWNVSLVPIKVFSAAGSTSTDALVKGIEYATTLGVFATNNSWGGAEYSEAIFGAIQRAKEKDIIFVAAAGNESENNDIGLHFPSNLDVSNIISVAAIDRHDSLAIFSNYGENTVDVAAPGEDIYSTLPQGKYGIKSGTSMAAPHVTGALALIKSKFPELSADEIKAKIINSTVRTNALSKRVIHGRIQVANALEKDETAPSKVVGFDITRSGLNNLALSWSASGDDGEVGEASQYLIRISSEAVSTEEQWGAATVIHSSDMRKESTAVFATLRNLDFNLSGFVTIRAQDNVGNLSALSESLAFTLAKSEGLWTEDNGEDQQWLGLTPPWGVRESDEITMISDSPDGYYQNGINKSVMTKSIDLGQSELILEIRHRFELEKEFDYGYVEISVDGGRTFKVVGQVNGTSGWTNDSYELKSILGENTAFQIRLRVKSDLSVSYEGWDIDSLKLIGVKAE